MKIDVDVEGRLPSQFEATRQRVDFELKVALRNIGEAAKSMLLSLAPKNVTGNFRRRIGFSTKARAVEAGSRAPHAHLVEDGRDPGKMPPPAKLAKTLGISTSEAFPIARAIGARGTQGHHLFARTRAQLEPVVEREAAAVLRRIGDAKL